MKRIITGILVVLVVSVGLLTILGSGGTTDSDGATRQWIKYHSSRDNCKEWCYNRADDYLCNRVGFRYEAGICTCDGYKCE